VPWLEEPLAQESRNSDAWAGGQGLGRGQADSQTPGRLCGAGRWRGGTAGLGFRLSPQGCSQLDLCCSRSWGWSEGVGNVVGSISSPRAGPWHRRVMGAWVWVGAAPAPGREGRRFSCFAGIEVLLLLFL